MIRLQLVREICQLFENLSFDHRIPSSSSVSRMYVKLVNCSTSHLIILFLPLHPSLARTWTFVKCLKTLISSSYPFLFTRLPQRVRDFFLSIILILIIWPSLSSVSRMYVNLFNCLNTSYQIILPLPLYPSPESTLIDCLKLLIWSSYLFLFIRLQIVCKLGQLLNYLSDPSYPFLNRPSPARTWTFPHV